MFFSLKLLTVSLRLHHVARVGGLHCVFVRVVHRVLVGQAAVGQIVHHSVTLDRKQNCSSADAAGRFIFQLLCAFKQRTVYAVRCGSRRVAGRRSGYVRVSALGADAEDALSPARSSQPGVALPQPPWCLHHHHRHSATQRRRRAADARTDTRTKEHHCEFPKMRKLS
jgi:hypothetical protein